MYFNTFALSPYFNGEGVMSQTPIKKEESNDQDDKFEFKKYINEGKLPLKADNPKKKPQLGTIQANQPIPSIFDNLFNLFKVINTTYTFLYLRNSLTITFPLLNSSVKQSLKKELTIGDLSQLREICPQIIELNYKSLASLALEINKNVYTDLNPELYTGSTVSQSSEYVLVIELLETQERSSKRRRREGPTMKANIQRQKLDFNNLKKAIELRNQKFLQGIKEYIKKCQLTELDPTQQLLTQSRKNQPVPPDSPSIPNDSIENCNLNTKACSIEELLNEIASESSYEGQIVQEALHTYPAVEAQYGALSRPLSQELINALYTSRNIEKTYKHQADAINHLWNGFHVIVSTSTSSGKSLIYQIPILQSLLEDNQSTAFFVFPTKSLAQDQKKSLIDILSYMPTLKNIRVDTFDGDTPLESRESIIRSANIIFTNPDMLHQTILPNANRWYYFFKNLKLFVLDEAHVYNGIFGVHVAFVLRRMRRIAEYFGNSQYRFVSCSATIEDPLQHMKKIFGVDNIKLINYTSSPSGSKKFVMWNPPYVDPKHPDDGKKSAISEASKLLIKFAEKRVRTIVFCRVRKTCESLMRLVRQELKTKQKGDLLSKIQSYRAGYTVQERRKIESEMFNGKLYGIIATNALELGIDIGSLDAVITIGFPYSLSNLRQQFGRAGRRNKSSLAVYIVETFPVDQFYLKHPILIHTQPNAELTLDLTNEVLLASHLQCAAYELPINIRSDEKFFGNQIQDICEANLEMVEESYRPHPKYLPFPASQVRIRSVSEDMFTLVDVTNDKNVILELLEPFRVALTAYEGAVYVYQGKTFIIRLLNINKRIITAHQVDVEWSTLQRDFTDVDPVRSLMKKTMHGSTNIYFGAVKATLHVFGYFKVNKQKDILDVVDITDHPVEIDSRGFWIDVPWHIIEVLSLKKINGAASIHAAQHALLSLMPIFISNSGNDIRTECKAGEKEYKEAKSERRRPSRLIFYDNCGDSSGAGLCNKAYEHTDELITMAIERIESCDCKVREGCPGCITSSKFEGGVCSGEVLDKGKYRYTLHFLLDGEAIPYRLVA